MVSDKERTYGGLTVATRRAERRERFLNTAIEIFGTAGFRASSVDAVCATAGLSRRQFYEEFSNREDLLVAAYDAIQQTAEAAVRKRIADLTSPMNADDVASDLFAVYLESVAASPARARVSYVEIVGVSDWVEKRRRERRAKWVPLIEETIRQVHGDTCCLPGAPGMAAVAVIGAINLMAQEWSLATPRPPLSDVVDVLRAFVAGLANADHA
ncbi:TetR/AcrR family transcriptional regulator [Rhodococcus fascians]|nr:TetR/AcrR family transcriptional regulator [Rhodococcus fascians]MBY4058099.1 TetR/AcrR family transcriptional regulator [Rhodococcus fascians]MBY4069742.1 TetR/AcrR family transcriptional regulator [Rhodococcus fascians]